MKVVLPKKPKLNTKAIVLYTISLITCIIAIIIVGLSFYYGSDELDRLVTIGGSSSTQADVDYEFLVSNFDTVFQNQLEDYSIDLHVKKIDENQDLIYTYYEKCPVRVARQFVRAQGVVFRTDVSRLYEIEKLYRAIDRLVAKGTHTEFPVP